MKRCWSYCLWSEENIICAMALRKLVLASNTSLLIWNAVHLVQFYSVQSNLVYVSPFRSTLVPFGPILSTWSISVHIGPFPSIAIHCDRLWSLLSISVHFDPFNPFRSTSIHSVQFYISSFFPCSTFFFVFLVSKPNQPYKWLTYDKNVIGESSRVETILVQ